MGADLSRNSFRAFNHFTRVLMQQGRVQLDADWNEQAAILLRYLQTSATDLIGAHGGPAQNLGFSITPLTDQSGESDFQIGAGRYYVDGLLCEADATPVAVTPVQSQTGAFVVEDWAPDGVPLDEISYVEVFDSTANAYTLAQVSKPNAQTRQLTLAAVSGASLPANVAYLRRAYTYLHQLDYSPSGPDATLPTASSYLVYLDVWERLISSVEDDRIREVALGGADTAMRAKVVWQVRVVPFSTGQTPSCGTAQDLSDRFQIPNRGWLRAQVEQSASSPDPCIVSPESRYRGPENQLYRVEIHHGGPAWDGTTTDGNPAGNASSAATFKWSRENGSVVFPIVTLLTGDGSTTATLENLGRDDRFGLTVGDLVEVMDDDHLLDYVVRAPATSLLSVQSIDRTSLQVVLSGTPGATVGGDPTKHPLLRRWDHKQGDPVEGGLTLGNDNAALIREDVWLELEDGVQIQFQKLTDPNGNQYRPGDYWLIPARTATGDVEWPKDTPKDSQGNPVKDSQGNPVVVPIAKPPDGVTHHYAPLAVIGSNNKLLRKCRNVFVPMGKPESMAP
jgi:hypothetical protein